MTQIKLGLLAMAALSLLTSTNLQAAKVISEVFLVDGTAIGQVLFEDNPYGLLINPNLAKLPTGLHGFHIHQHPTCQDKGMAAGDHLDPKASKSHLGPYQSGHIGDLPVLVVDNKGEARIPVLAPRLTTKDIKGHALMIHANGDNYSNTPPLGGGGARIACGEIKK